MSDNPYRNDDDDAVRSPKKGMSGCTKIGCGCLVLFLLVAGSCAAMFSGVVWALQQSDAYVYAIEQVEKHPQVSEALGTPVESGILVTGNINLDNDDGTVDLEIPVSGPKGSGTIKVSGTKTDGVWNFDNLICVIDATGQVINLMDVPEEAPEEAVPAE